jgi:hypothetical protein
LGFIAKLPDGVRNYSDPVRRIVSALKARRAEGAMQTSPGRKPWDLANNYDKPGVVELPTAKELAKH